MTITKALTLSVAAALIGLVTAPQSANAWHARSYHRTTAYTVAPYYAQSYFPDLAVYGDASNLYMYGYASGYRSAYGCLWFDRNCPW